MRRLPAVDHLPTSDVSRCHSITRSSMDPSFAPFQVGTHVQLGNDR